MNAIELTGVSKTYRGKQGTKVEALKDLSLLVNPGEIFGFLGPNGAGKSTTIKIMMGLIAPTVGSARIFGLDSRDGNSRTRVGYLPENPSFYDFLTAEEYLLFVCDTFGLPRLSAYEDMEKILKRMDLWEARKRQVRSYSKGMVQRLGLAQVLVHDPDLYILDEPMSGLDPVGRALVKEILLELKKQGKSVFFSTHITSDVESICDRVGIIVRGKLERVEEVGSILRERIEGYTVHLQDVSGVRQVYVQKQDLQRFLTELPGESEVVLIEPDRKSLEDFFLRLVNVNR
ncbi:ABC-2 type transport system ATP-binding protein [Geobacter sp. DSM 9736]|nr:ABC transporter ATP-binding protein [Geobacter sp. DSM 9736]SNB45834.1 ABC-2 type transport system ATP-binding protein [Geobacter sp. DSM 9736]